MVSAGATITQLPPAGERRPTDSTPSTFYLESWGGGSVSAAYSDDRQGPSPPTIHSGPMLPIAGVVVLVLSLGAGSVYMIGRLRRDRAGRRSLRDHNDGHAGRPAASRLTRPSPEPQVRADATWNGSARRYGLAGLALLALLVGGAAFAVVPGPTVGHALPWQSGHQILPPAVDPDAPASSRCPGERGRTHGLDTQIRPVEAALDAIGPSRCTCAPRDSTGPDSTSKRERLEAPPRGPVRSLSELLARRVSGPSSGASASMDFVDRRRRRR